MRKFALSLIALAPAAFLAACASSGALTGDAANTSATTSEVDKLNSDCVARGGTLAPSPRRLTGQPQLDNYCRINPVEPRG